MHHIHPISELKNNLNQLAEICRRENEPVFLTRKGHGDLVLLSLEGYERMVAKLKEHEGCNMDNEALWVREAEARYDEIASGKVPCRPLDEAIKDARNALK
ncbi:MAG: type II toxin-antitoxin system Phd/YefM family antitoxin [Geobacter sp.]|nr:MAG: type II toxin-antitoxin system Phd/YefM family antitoxin [Geobacter sp.]